jgi:hypothetical protein
VIIKDAKNNINKIGNYCLLTQPWNSKNKNLSFARKKDLLKDNVSPLYRNHSNSNIDISSKKQWNFLEISKRSEEIIKIITTKIYSDK